jgi:hypothetical protein
MLVDCVVCFIGCVQSKDSKDDKSGVFIGQLMSPMQNWIKSHHRWANLLGAYFNVHNDNTLTINKYLWIFQIYEFTFTSLNVLVIKPRTSSSSISVTAIPP